MVKHRIFRLRLIGASQQNSFFNNININSGYSFSFRIVSAQLLEYFKPQGFVSGNIFARTEWGLMLSFYRIVNAPASIEPRAKLVFCMFGTNFVWRTWLVLFTFGSMFIAWSWVVVLMFRLNLLLDITGRREK